jgi:tetraacyldisaccharide-1-P 4'-kinase
VNLSDCVIIVDRGRYSPLLKNIKIPRFFARVEPVNLPKIRKVIGFCGIGNPESFRRILIENGYDLCEFYIFRDHHFYKDEEIRFLKNRCRIKNADGIITTEKDIIKIKDDDIFYIKTELKVEDSFFRFLSSSHPEIPI